MTELCAFHRRQLLAFLLISLAASLVAGTGRAAEDAVSLSITIADHKFDPAELHAPPGRPIEIHVKNLNPIVSEFESGDLHFEKIIPVGKEGVVYVRPQQPGRYTFFDDFHRETQGALVVP
jgi:plastocyanin